MNPRFNRQRKKNIPGALGPWYIAIIAWSGQNAATVSAGGNGYAAARGICVPGAHAGNLHRED
jgi:hypothetical protein